MITESLCMILYNVLRSVRKSTLNPNAKEFNPRVFCSPVSISVAYFITLCWKHCLIWYDMRLKYTVPLKFLGHLCHFKCQLSVLLLLHLKLYFDICMIHIFQTLNLLSPGKVQINVNCYTLSSFVCSSAQTSNNSHPDSAPGSA